MITAAATNAHLVGRGRCHPAGAEKGSPSPRATQRGEQVEQAGAKLVHADALVAGGVCEVGDAKEPAEQRERYWRGMMGEMRALRLHEDGLRVEEIELPEPGPGEVLVRVHAAAITRDELTWPTERLPAIPSYELSGVVVDGGDEVVALTLFDRDGVAAEYAVVPTAVLAPKPPELTYVEAAALPMGALSAQQGLFVHGGLRPGERVLVTGASGGVGHLAVQLARHAGAEVVAEEPVDLVFDTAGADPLPRAGRVVTIAAEAPGATYFVVEPDGAQLAEALRAGLRPAIDSVFPLERAREAFERVAARGKRGKVVLDVAGG